MFEFVQDHPRARQLMILACENSKFDWKVFLESINFEMRCGALTEALEIAKRSLTIHLATGRLWSAVIQLQHAIPDMLEQFLP